MDRRHREELSVIDEKEARALAMDYLRDLETRGAPPLVLRADATEEHPFGWVFFYDGAAAIGSGPSGLAGNAPVLVERATGRVLTTGTALPLADYLEAYLATGHPHGELGTVITFTRTDAVRARPVEVVETIRRRVSVSAHEVLLRVKQAEAGGAAELDAGDAPTADALVRELRELGFSAARAVL